MKEELKKVAQQYDDGAITKEQFADAVLMILAEHRVIGLAE